MDVRIRRVRREDFDQIAALAASLNLEPPTSERATLRRFRNIVGDMGCDFDVAERAGKVCGFVHVAYIRTLLEGNRGQLVALVADGTICRNRLFEAAVRRAARRQCRDLTAFEGAWLDASTLRGLAPLCTPVASGVAFQIDGMPPDAASATAGGDKL